MGCKQKYHVQFQNVFWRGEHSFPLLFPAGWSVDAIARAGAAILDHELEGRIPIYKVYKFLKMWWNRAAMLALDRHFQSSFRWEKHKLLKPISVTIANVILIYQMSQFWPVKPKSKYAGWLLGKMLFLPVKWKPYFPILAVLLLHAFGHGCMGTQCPKVQRPSFDHKGKVKRNSELLPGTVTPLNCQINPRPTYPRFLVQDN